jgi:hypothetical protein
MNLKNFTSNGKSIYFVYATCIVNGYFEDILKGMFTNSVRAKEYKKKIYERVATCTEVKIIPKRVRNETKPIEVEFI